MIHHGDLFDVLPTLEEASVDACVTDPPYDLTSGKRGGSGEASLNLDSPAGRSRISTGGGFMGQRWDGEGVAFRVETWAAVSRVLKPGAHVLAFGGTRTFHRMTCAIEDAGFEIRDCLSWLYGSGFPKGLNVVTELVKLATCQSSETALCAVQSSASIRVRSSVEKERIAVAFARILPAGELALLTEIGGAVALHVPMDTWPLGWTERIGLNMTCSSSGSLDDHWQRTSKSITATVSETTTDARTFSWLTGLHTSAITILSSVTLLNGCKWPAIAAASNSTGDSTNMPATLLVTALGSATWNPVVRNIGANVALKPAWEPIVLARKPFRGSVSANVLAHGTGALNVDACRIDYGGKSIEEVHREAGSPGRGPGPTGERTYNRGWNDRDRMVEFHALGRWPSNVLLDEEAAALLDEQSGELSPGHGARCNLVGPGTYGIYGRFNPVTTSGPSDSGGASRFFYVAKPSREERNTGTERNIHPTVKPIELMRWLVKLVTPIGGTVLDPFAGSGTTGMACAYELRSFIGIEREAEYVAIAKRRIGACIPLFGEATS